MRTLALVAGIWLVVSGCASPTIWANGDLGAGIPLATVQAVGQPCGIEDAAGCSVMMWWRRGEQNILQVNVYLRDTLTEHQRDAAFAHELCHALAAAQHLPDTCHKQDGGRLR